ncbi:MAG: type III pantothenate kinase [Acetobacter sp.]|nr:type III pantothenate kinase [Bacteroides sp.]MCM1340204.1 type III pantothenate kinase [Acetobacter sp.]MCM1432844.1 type III pantothenate kinase [Clostridiales bacterium]
MILGIDVGNTNTVCALIENGILTKEYRYNTEKSENAEYYKLHIKEVVCNTFIDGVIISSVVPEINDCLRRACNELFDLSPIFVSSNLNTGLSIKYDNPEKLGADLITAAAGAVSKYKTPLIIIDIGTATTFSVINEKNEYLGGLIAPGPYTSVKALASSASQLPEISIEATDKVIGTNTVDAIKVGVITAHSAMIDTMADRIINSLGFTDTTLISTGGFSEKITSMCINKIIFDENLIFDGLYQIYKMNF